MEIKVLGSGCANCKRLEENVHKALSEIGISADVVKVTDIAEIMSFGIMSPPGIVVNGELKSSGKVLSVDEIIAILRG